MGGGAGVSGNSCKARTRKPISLNNDRNAFAVRQSVITDWLIASPRNRWFTGASTQAVKMARE